MVDIQQAIAQTKALTLPMAKLRIKSKHQLEVDGRPIKLSDVAFKDLLKLVGLSNKTVTHINDEIHRDAGFMLVKEIMKAMSVKKGVNISLLVDTSDLEIKRICLEGETSGSTTAIAPAAIQDLICQVLDNSPNTKLANTFISDGGTRVVFNLKHDNPIKLPMRGEDIVYGKQIIWDLLQPTTITDFVERQICANGMTGIAPSFKSISLNSTTDPSVWYKELFHGIMNPKKEFIEHYGDRVREAMNTNLSVYEYNTIKSHLMGIWAGDGGRIMRYLGDERWKNSYDKNGIDLTKLTAGQLRNCPTPVNSWDAINCLTDMASHTYTTPVSDSLKRATQKMAGNLLNKAWDVNQQIYNVPVFKPAPVMSNVLFN